MTPAVTGGLGPKRGVSRAETRGSLGPPSVPHPIRGRPRPRRRRRGRLRRGECGDAPNLRSRPHSVRTRPEATGGRVIHKPDVAEATPVVVHILRAGGDVCSAPVLPIWQFGSSCDQFFKAPETVAPPVSKARRPATPLSRTLRRRTPVRFGRGDTPCQLRV